MQAAECIGYSECDKCQRIVNTRFGSLRLMVYLLYRHLYKTAVILVIGNSRISSLDKQCFDIIVQYLMACSVTYRINVCRAGTSLVLFSLNSGSRVTRIGSYKQQSFG